VVAVSAVPVVHVVVPAVSSGFAVIGVLVVLVVGVVVVHVTLVGSVLVDGGSVAVLVHAVHHTP